MNRCRFRFMVVQRVRAWKRSASRISTSTCYISACWMTTCRRCYCRCLLLRRSGSCSGRLMRLTLMLHCVMAIEQKRSSRLLVVRGGRKRHRFRYAWSSRTSRRLTLARWLLLLLLRQLLLLRLLLLLCLSLMRLWMGDSNPMVMASYRMLLLTMMVAHGADTDTADSGAMGMVIWIVRAVLMWSSG